MQHCTNDSTAGVRLNVYLPCISSAQMRSHVSHHQ